MRALCLAMKQGSDNWRESAVLEIIKKLSKSGITILMVEHNIEAVMKISDRVVVLAEGSVIADGQPEDVRNNLKVIEDNAQAIGCEYTFSNGEKKYTGTK